MGLCLQNSTSTGLITVSFPCALEQQIQTMIMDMESLRTDNVCCWQMYAKQDPEEYGLWKFTIFQPIPTLAIKCNSLGSSQAS
jgi:hypothetical protein